MYDIHAAMQLSRQDDIWAYGMVTIDKSIRFMVQLRKYKADDGMEKMKLCYPRKEENGIWKDVIHPCEELKQEIQEAVVCAVKEEIERDLHLPAIEDILIMPEYEPVNGKVKVCGRASVQICGLWIEGITIKQGLKGFFINMPQYRQADGRYRDLVYAITKELQEKISDAVIAAYIDTV